MSNLKRTIHKVVQSHIALALLVSSLTIIWLASHWSADYEEMPTFAYSLGNTGQNAIGFGTEYREGEFSWFGIALYDLNQGAGVRLPTQGSWSQNPLGFLRNLVGIESIILTRLYVSLAATVWVVSYCINAFGGSFVLARRLVASLIVAAIAPSFIGHTDWSGAVVFNWSIIAIFSSLVSNEQSRDSEIPAVGVKLAAGIATINLITEHPGWIPMASVFLGSVLLVLAVYRKLKLRATTFSVALSAVALVNLVVIYLDLQNSLGGLPQSGSSQGLTSETAAEDAGYFGFTSGALPWEIEYVLVQALRLSFMPLLSILQPLISKSDAGWYLMNDLPARRPFLGLAALLLVVFFRRWRSDRVLFRIAVATLFALATTFVYAIFQDLDMIPNSTKTSGTWLVSRGVAGSIGVLLLVLIGKSSSGFGRRVKVFIGLNVSLYLLSALSLFGVVPATYNSIFSVPYSAQQRSIGERENRLVSVVADLKSLSVKRLLFVGSDDLVPMELLKSDFAVIAPLFPKIRSVSPIGTSPKAVGLFTVREFDLRELHSRRIADFLNVDVVGVRIEDDSKCREAGGRNLTPDCIGTIGFTDLFGVYRSKGFSTFTYRELGDPKDPCAIMEKSCAVFEQAVAGQARQQPRLSVCSDSCLAQFEYELGVNRINEWLLLPIRHDPALRIRELSSGDYISLVDSGGFTSVSTKHLKQTGTLQIEVELDLMMVARTAVSYLNVVFLVVLLVASNRAIRSRLSLLNSRFSALEELSRGTPQSTTQH